MKHRRRPLSTLVLAAVTGEVEPLVRQFKLRRSHNRLADAEGAIVYHQPNLTVAVTGMGAERACHVAEAARQQHPPSRVIITGFAGAADPALNVGEIIQPAVLRHLAADTEAVATCTPTAATRVEPLGCLLTCDHLVATPAEKARLRAEHAADAVDMESAALAAWCDAHDLPWTCIRAISDTADEALPPFVERLTRPNGQPDVFAAGLYVLTRPWKVPPLIRLGRAAATAAQALANRLRDELRE